MTSKERKEALQYIKGELSIEQIGFNGRSLPMPEKALQLLDALIADEKRVRVEVDGWVHAGLLEPFELGDTAEVFTIWPCEMRHAQKRVQFTIREEAQGS